MQTPDTKVSPTALLALSVDKRDARPAYAQLYRRIRELILAGTFKANERLPSTRGLASDLGLSRTTVNAAYDQLLSEGYIRARRGAGVYVTDLPPDRLLLVQKPDRPPPDNPPERHQAPPSSSPLHRKAEEPAPRPFQPYAVAFEQFPHQLWARLLSRTWRSPPSDLLWRADPFGHYPLRAAIAEHLRVWRGIACSAEQIAITCGIGDALDVVLRAMDCRGETVWLEDPGFAEMRNAITANGYKAAPMPVDGDGLDVDRAARTCPDARAAIVTPSRQFPLGMTLSLARRLALLDWAQRRDAWVIEDDFDSEYRFSGQPLSPLMALDESDCVIYLGSFSKVMLRSLRLGYIVCPPSFVAQVRTVLERHGAKASLIAQPALAQFISSGEFAAYIRKTRRLYAKRLGTLRTSLQDMLEKELIVQKQTGGLHLTAEMSHDLCARTTDTALSHKAREAELVVPALSTYYAEKPAKQGFLLGFAGFDEETIRDSVERFAGIIHRSSESTGA